MRGGRKYEIWRLAIWKNDRILGVFFFLNKCLLGIGRFFCWTSLMCCLCSFENQHETCNRIALEFLAHIKEKCFKPTCFQMNQKKMSFLLLSDGHTTVIICQPHQQPQKNLWKTNSAHSAPHDQNVGQTV